MTRTLWAVILLVTANLTLPAFAVQLATRGADPLALVGLNAVATAIGLTLAALDPTGIIRSRLDGGAALVASLATPAIEPAPTPAPVEEPPAHA